MISRCYPNVVLSYLELLLVYILLLLFYMMFPYFFEHPNLFTAVPHRQFIVSNLTSVDLVDTNLTTLCERPN